MAKNPINTTPDTDGLEPWQCIKKQRLLRLLAYLLKHGSITRQHADEVAPAANSPQEFMGLRRKGFDLPCERVPHITIDGAPSWYGRYYLTEEDKVKAIEVLRRNGRHDV